MTSTLADKWTFFDKFIQSLRYRRVVHLIPKGSVVLDCGCGNGEFLRYAHKRIARGYGIDTVKGDFAGGETGTFMEGDLDQKIPAEDGSFDVVTGLAVLEHLNHPVVFIEEIFRILKTGGCCVLTTPSPRAKLVLELLAYKIRIISEKDIKDHKTYFNREELRRLFGKFSNVKIYYFLFGFNTIIVAKK
jgi:2-polyprenyl-3-methyl-5-hydroxy-6-metoxy-1,4-benzoquinol methylase